MRGIRRWASLLYLLLLLFIGALDGQMATAMVLGMGSEASNETLDTEVCFEDCITKC